MRFSDFMLLEKKDHIINKIPSLTDEQKKAIIDYFTKKPNMESKIDWNRWKDLTYADFYEVLNTASKSEIKKKVKQTGIAGLEEGTDYRVFPLENDSVVGYVPLTWEASKHIASSHIGSCEGKWCTAYQKTDKYWRDYVGGKRVVLVYFIVTPPAGEEDIEATKFAIAIYPDNSKYEIYNAQDNNIDEYHMNDLLPEGSKIDIEADILSHTDFLDEIREYTAENIEPAELTDADLQELAEDFATDVSRDFRGEEAAISAARSIIDSEYQSVNDYADESNMSVDDMKEHIRSRFYEWEGGYTNIMEYMEEKYGIDPDNLQNKINALSYCEWAASESIDSKYSSDLRERVLELDWKYTYDQSYDDMIQAMIDDRGEYRSFDDLKEDVLKKWLEYAYENNHDEFIKFKENFVNDYNEIIGINESGYKTYNKLSADEVAYINGLINTAEKVGYKRVADQTALNLDGVNYQRYLNKFMGS